MRKEMTQKERFERLISYFEEARPTAQTELHYSNAYELLVAVMLSAQCTDQRVNQVTPALFKCYPSVFELAKATPEEVFALIRSISYPNSKSKHLVGMAQKLVSDFAGEVPSDIEELQTLPGVGRKTANVIASVIFNLPALAVDTHVFRVANRIGLTKNSKNPLQTERELVKYIPDEKIPIAHHWLILHGRYVCNARKPQCKECGITDICDFFNNVSGTPAKVKSKQMQTTKPKSSNKTKVSSPAKDKKTE